MRAFVLCALLLLAPALAGCSEDPADEPATTTSSSSSTSESATNSTTSRSSTTSSSATSTGSASSTTTGPASNSTGNATGNSTGNTTGGAPAPIQHFEGEWPVGTMGCALRPAAPGSIYADTFFVETEVDPLTIGRTFTAAFTTTPDNQNIYVEFTKGDGASVGTDAEGVTGTLTGTVPEDAEWVRFINCGAAGASVVYDA